MSKVGKYDKLYKYISRKLNHAEKNSLEGLLKQLEAVKNGERDYEIGAICYFNEPNFELEKEVLKGKILQKMAETIKEEIVNDKFIDVLYKYIDKRGYKESDLYNKANVSKQVFSKIRQGTIPSISTVVKLVLALECESDEMDYLLKTAGYALQDSNAYDMMIRFFVNNKIFRSYEEYDKYLEYYDFFEAVAKKWPGHTNKYKDWFKEEKKKT